jgi:hypothetical protein
MEKNTKQGDNIKVIFKESNGDGRMDSHGPKQGTVKGSSKHGYEL